jgi:xanthine dehydrogenase YagR molybdenum-binding subunit
MNDLIGKPQDRVDGRLKVTGQAKYTAEFSPDNMAYGVLVDSTISKGHINKIDTHIAENAPGVIKVITYKNSLMLHQPDSSGDSGAKLGEKDMLPLQSERIHYDGQHIAIVVAETFEQAEYAASLVKVDYNEGAPALDIEQVISTMYQPKAYLGRDIQFKKGDADEALKNAQVSLKQTYGTPVYHHNAMEPHATVAEWNGDELTVYDSTQSVMGSKNAIAQLLGIPAEKVRLISLFVGGGFGSKGFMWPHSVLAPMAAKITGRPVKIALSRQQMFSGNGRRARTIQEISLGAGQDGKLSAVKHNIITESSFVDEFTEPAGIATPILYNTPALQVQHNLVRLNRGTPAPMRAPGEAPGTYAYEAALDELAYELKIDPVELRLINYADKEPQEGKEWSAKNLRECYEQGREAIGWASRSPAPGSMRDGRYLVGYGMATATYPANRLPATARITIYADGHAQVECCSQDIGTGTSTIMAQIAGATLGLPVERVIPKLGDSKLPKGPGSGGSQTSASIGPAIRAAAIGALNKVIQLAAGDQRSPLYGADVDDVMVENGRLHLKNDPGKGETYSHILRRNGTDKVEDEIMTNVSTRENQSSPKKPEDKEKKSNAASDEDEEKDRKKYAFHSFGAQFVKVKVDPYLGAIKVTDCVSVMDIGAVLNLKTAKNQIMGGMIFALGMALMEGTSYDPNNGRLVTRDLANYLVPVHADMPVFDIRFINKPDFNLSPIGSRGVGEIGITGTAAAIANAVYHATGKRVRELPITPDKLL